MSEHSGHGLPNNASTTKIPPGWNEAESSKYSFRQYKLDLRYWLTICELHEVKIGPAMGLRLKGTARSVADSLQRQECAHEPGNVMASPLSHGQWDWNRASGVLEHTPGWQLLLQHLSTRYDM